MAEHVLVKRVKNTVMEKYKQAFTVCAWSEKSPDDEIITYLSSIKCFIQHIWVTSSLSHWNQAYYSSHTLTSFGWWFYLKQVVLETDYNRAVEGYRSNTGILMLLGFDLMTFWPASQCLNHWPTTAHLEDNHDHLSQMLSDLNVTTVFSYVFKPTKCYICESILRVSEKGQIEEPLRVHKVPNVQLDDRKPHCVLNHTWVTSLKNWKWEIFKQKDIHYLWASLPSKLVGHYKYPDYIWCEGEIVWSRFLDEPLRYNSVMYVTWVLESI